MKVCWNCSLLIKQAIKITAVAIEKGTGNGADVVVKTYMFVSKQSVPLVW